MQGRNQSHEVAHIGGSDWRGRDEREDEREGGRKDGRKGGGVSRLDVGYNKQVSHLREVEFS